MQGIESLKNKGRFGDTELAHLTKGEVVLPVNFVDKYPTVKNALEKALKKEDTLLNELIVGDSSNSINPETGLPEFFLKNFKKKVGKFFKKVRKVLDPVAQVARFVPGPWQPYANIYTKARAAGRIVTGEGGIGDAVTLFTGPKVLGDTGSFSQITGGTGSIGDTFSSIKEYVLPGEDKRGIFKNIGRDVFGIGQQISPEDVDAYAKGEGFMKSGDKYIDEFGGSISVDDMAKKAASATGKSNIFSGIFGKTPSGRKFNVFDDLLGIVPGKGGVFGTIGDIREGIENVTGLDPVLLAMSKAFADATEKAAEKQKGGLEDIRVGKREDLKLGPVYGSGFDVGLGNPITAGQPINAYAKGGEVVGEPNYAEGGEVLDMREGGESVGPGTGTSDDIPAMLSDGEFVMTAKANLGAGSMQMKKKKGGIMELSPALEPDRQRGAKNMMKLMKYFEGVA